MIILKWVVGILVGLAIVTNMADWEAGKEDIERLFATILMMLVEFIIIRG